MKFLGIDYGEKKIGIAKSAGVLAVPYRIIGNGNDADVVTSIGEICEKESIEKIVVGIPRSLSGARGKQYEKVKKFLDSLSRLGLPVVEEDETMSTKMVHGMQGEGDRKGDDDASSAAIILQTYLDREGNRK